MSIGNSHHFAIHHCLTFRLQLAASAIFAALLPFSIAAQQVDTASQAYKLCMNTCTANSCSGPASVVEKNCAKKCALPASAIETVPSHGTRVACQETKRN